MNLSKKIRAIENYPIEGVTFRDITTLLRDKEAYKESIDKLIDLARPYQADQVLGIEARGFIVGSAVAYGLGSGFVMVRKPGKLPYEIIAKDYGLEYGKDRIEIHKDSIEKGERVIIIDDLLATGGTCRAAIDLVEELGGRVEACIFLIELTGLPGREVLEGYEVKSVVKYD